MDCSDFCPSQLILAKPASLFILDKLEVFATQRVSSFPQFLRAPPLQINSIVTSVT